MSLSDRLRRLEKQCAASDEGWKPYDKHKLSPRAEELFDEVRRFRDSHPDPAIRQASVMDILGPEAKETARKATEEYEARHEWRWINGRCYIRRRPGFGRR